MKPKRNDRWLNSHMEPLMKVWRANMDMQLTIDLGKVIGYMTKYVTKSEASLTKGAARMMMRVLTKSIEEGHTAQHALKKGMQKLMGERTMSKQEKCHLIMSLPTVTCSHTFVKINLLNDGNRILLFDEDTPVAQDTNNNVNGNGGGDGGAEQQAPPRAAKMSLMDAYRECTNEEHWLSQDEFNAFKDILPTLPFREFAVQFTVGERLTHRNKIKCRTKQNTVLMFYPQYSSNPSSPDYTKYCRTAMIKYVPWAGKDPQSLWGGEQATDEQIRQAWAHHLQSFGDVVPDWIRKEIEDYHRVPRASRNTVDFESEIDPDDLEPTEFAEEYHVNPDDAEQIDPDRVDLQWDHDHDWSNLQHDYDEHTVLDEAEQIQLLDNFILPVEATADDGIELNERQRLAVEMIVECAEIDDPDEIAAGAKTCILVGRGGTGKSTTLNAAIRRLEEIYGVGKVLKMATTGMAATVIGGSTLHSKKHGLGIPVGRTPWRGKAGFSQRWLSEMFEKLKDMIMACLDEYSMTKARELYYASCILQYIFGNDKLFGGLLFALLGDNGQFGPVAGEPLFYIGPESLQKDHEDDRRGKQIFICNFKKVIELVEVKRVLDDPTAAEFLEILDGIRNGNCTEAQWRHVCETCSRDTMTVKKFQERFRDDTDITYLFTTNEKVEQHNAKMLKQLGKPIALIEAEHTGRSKSMNSSAFMGLNCFLFLSVFAKVVMTQNVCQPAGLCNGATGTVMDIVYNDGEGPPSLPKFVWVDFGDNYKGPSFFPRDETRRGWVAVRPRTSKEWTFSGRGGGVRQEHTRTMLPLRCAWGWTVWKAQGQTMKGQVIAELGDREPDAGITYVAFSRVTKMENFGIIGGLTYDRFTSKIRNHPKFAARAAEEKRLRDLSEKTVERLLQKLARSQNQDE
jgi:hypothetical protein